MKKVFSFSLFGNEPKYCKGLLKNVQVIEKAFPGWEVWVYCGEGIPEDTILALSDYPFVKFIGTGETGMMNKFFRFFPIDDPDVEICIVRDADSRIYARDTACIQEFLASDKCLHIIRDHPNHHHRMMAGMWGCRKDILKYLPFSFTVMFIQWRQSRSATDFWSDTQYLCDMIYPYVWQQALVHDETQNYEPTEQKKPFPYPLEGEHFIGQVYEFNGKGEEFPKFTYNT